MRDQFPVILLLFDLLQCFTNRVTQRSFLFRLTNLKLQDDSIKFRLTLFDTVREDDIIEELKNLELGNMTPIDALNTLYRMQTKLKNRWSGNEK